MSEYKELIFTSPDFLNQNYFCLSSSQTLWQQEGQKGQAEDKGSLTVSWGAIPEAAEALEVLLCQEKFWGLVNLQGRVKTWARAKYRLISKLSKQEILAAPGGVKAREGRHEQCLWRTQGMLVYIFLSGDVWNSRADITRAASSDLTS